MKKKFILLSLIAAFGFYSNSYAATKHITQKTQPQRDEDGFFTIQVFAVDMPDRKLSKHIKEYINRANATGFPIIEDFKPDYKAAIIKRSVASTRNIFSDLSSANKLFLVGMKSIPFHYNGNNRIIIKNTYKYDYTYPKDGAFFHKGDKTDIAKGTVNLGYILGSSMEDIKGTPYVGTRTLLTFTHPKSGTSPIIQLDPKHDDHYGNLNITTQAISRNFKMDSGQTVWFYSLQDGETYDKHNTMLVVGVTAVIFDKKPV